MTMFDPAAPAKSNAKSLFKDHGFLTGLIAASFIVAAVCFLLFLQGMFAVTFDARSGIADCGTGAPPPAGATPETYYIRAGYFPLGIDCVWMVGDDGQEVVERSNNWTASVITYGALLAAAGGTVVGIGTAGARSRLPRPPIEHAPTQNAG